jgi:multidrug resistance efflux pump
LAQAEYDRSDRGSDSPQALALEQATLDLQIIQSDYDRLVAGPRQTDLGPIRANIEVAKAQVPLAEAQVAQAQTQVAQAETQVIQAEAAMTQALAGVEATGAQTAQAQAALDRLQVGATLEEIAVAEAAVAQAREAVATAQALLDQARLTAPFDGTVGLVYVRHGEEVLPGQTVLLLGDLTTLRVETTDLDEIDVARVQPGQEADLTFDAIPEKELAGRVKRVAPMSTPGQSATTYTVIIEFEETDPALRWGMTAFVDISTE